jgi:hypothetical protein
MPSPFALTFYSTTVPVERKTTKPRDPNGRTCASCRAAFSVTDREVASKRFGGPPEPTDCPDCRTAKWYARRHRTIVPR